MRRRREESYESVGEVEILKETPKSYLCKWVDGGAERWMPKSQMPDGFSAEVGETVELYVTEWMQKQMEEGGEADAKKWVTVPGMSVVMRETEAAIQVRIEGRENLLWLPKGQLAPASEVKNDGDSGALIISDWIASAKGLGPGGSGGLSAGEDARQKDLFRGGDPDDDLKF